jgi:osmoprotectant transport system permease protein
MIISGALLVSAISITVDIIMGILKRILVSPGILKQETAEEGK